MQLKPQNTEGLLCPTAVSGRNVEIQRSARKRRVGCALYPHPEGRDLTAHLIKPRHDGRSARLTASVSFWMTRNSVTAGPLTRRVPCSHCGSRTSSFPSGEPSVPGELRLLADLSRGHGCICDGGAFPWSMGERLVKRLDQFFSKPTYGFSIPALLIAATIPSTARRSAGLRSVLADFAWARSVEIGMPFPP